VGAVLPREPPFLVPALSPDPVVAKPSLEAVVIAGNHKAIPFGLQTAIPSWNLFSGLLMVNDGIVCAFWSGWYWRHRAYSRDSWWRVRTAAAPHRSLLLPPQC